MANFPAAQSLQQESLPHKSVSYNFHVVQLFNSMAEEIENLKKECVELRQEHKTEIKSGNTIDRDKV